VARLASSVPESAFVGIILPVAGPAVFEPLQAETEGSSILFPRRMTCQTRRHPVGAREGELARLVVEGQTELGRRPSLPTVAIVASLRFEGACVRIGMTGAASVIAGPRVGSRTHLPPREDEAQPRLGKARGVAAPTERLGVGALQEETGGAVIEGGFHPVPPDLSPAQGGVASTAGTPHPSPVGILVADAAGRRVQRTISDRLTPSPSRLVLVAKRAFHLLMPTLQQIPCPGMVEFLRPFPILLIVTGGTVPIHELAFMGVITAVATRTIRAQPQVGPFQSASDRLEFPHILENDKVRAMAGPAIGLPMTTQQGVPRRVMGKRFCIKISLNVTSIPEP